MRRLPEPLSGAGPQAGALSAAAGGRAPRLAAAGSARWASPAGEAERKWRPRLCTNHVRPAGECHSAPRAGSEGAGRALASPPRRCPRPWTPRGRPPPRLPAGRRSVPGGSPPPPRSLRSRGGSGPARQAGPGGACGDPAAPGARPRPGRMTPSARRPPGTRRRSPQRAWTSAVTKPQGQAGRWPAERRTRRPSGAAAAAAAQLPGSRPGRPGPAPSPARSPPAASGRWHPTPAAAPPVRRTDEPWGRCGAPHQVSSRRGARHLSRSGRGAQAAGRTAGSGLFTLGLPGERRRCRTRRKTRSPPSVATASVNTHTHAHDNSVVKGGPTPADLHPHTHSTWGAESHRAGLRPWSHLSASANPKVKLNLHQPPPPPPPSLPPPPPPPRSLSSPSSSSSSRTCFP